MGSQRKAGGWEEEQVRHLPRRPWTAKSSYRSCHAHLPPFARTHRLARAPGPAVVMKDGDAGMKTCHGGCVLFMAGFSDEAGRDCEDDRVGADGKE